MSQITHQSILESGPYRDLTLQGIDRATAQALYTFMLRLRRCEEALAAEYHPADEMRCPVHFCIGQEAVPAALSVLLNEDDYLFSHHRSHGYYLAKGAPMAAMFAELYGRATGANGGRAGSQDISYPKRNFHSGAILAGAIALATGAGLASQLTKDTRVAVAGFGESACDEGVFWETISYAALRKLPVVYICENNNYSVFSPQLKRQVSDNLSERVSTFGMRSVPLFGNDVVRVLAAIEEAIDRARAGKGPTFVEAYTYRWSGHYGPVSDDLVGYRPQQDLDAWKQNCPIALIRNAMSACGWLSDSDTSAMLDKIDREIADSFRFAKESPFPDDSNWAPMNLSSTSPLADRLLVDIDTHVFDENQAFVQAKGY